MKTIPIRQIAATHQEQSITGRFSIRDLRAVLNGKDLLHELHKHDFYFILALEKGQGVHEIDFIQYNIHDHAVFLLRPGQVHQLQLTADSTGYLLEFDTSFYQPKNTKVEQWWKKAASKNYCEVEESPFKKMLSFLSNIFAEYSTTQEGYQEAIKANLDLFFIELVRQSPNPKQVSSTASTYTQERYEELLRLLEANIVEVKNVAQYAELLNLSVYQLNAITRASVGKTTTDLEAV